MNSKQNDSIWVLTDFSDIELLNSELKKGNPLTLENFTRLEFDSTRVQYLVHGTDKKRDIEIKKDVFKKGYKDYFRNFDNDSLENLNSQQYLEYLALEKAKLVRSYDLSENTQGGKIPHMNVMQKGKTDKFFKYVQFLAKFVGCDIFEKRPNVILRTSLEAEQAKVVPVPVEFRIVRDPDTFNSWVGDSPSLFVIL